MASANKMERIAEALNVNQATISRDLGNLCDLHKSKPAKTASNPQGRSHRQKARPSRQNGAPVRWR